jgi:hypothetical protein
MRLLPIKKFITISLCLFGGSLFADQAVKPFNGKNLNGWKQKGPAARSHLTVGTAKLDAKNPRAFTVTKGGNELINAKGGKKTANAKFLKVVLNDKLLHENVEMKGATPGGVGGKEKPKGPLMFQGNHGPVAYRNIVVRPLK